MEEIIKKIANQKLKLDLDKKYDNIYVETLLYELYYYSLGETKIIALETNLEEIFKLIERFLSDFIRKTDMWDALYIINKINKIENNKYYEFHEKLYDLLGGKNREYKELSDIYRLTLNKIGFYLKNNCKN